LRLAEVHNWMTGALNFDPARLAETCQADAGCSTRMTFLPLLRGQEVRNMLLKRKPNNRGDHVPPQPPALREEVALHPRDGVCTQSLIDASLTIIGDLWSEGDVQVDGHVCGNIRCAQLIVGRDAAITGTITAEQAVIRGRITGRIRATLVVLQDAAQVESEIDYNLLAIDEGASFEGAAHRRADPLQEEDAASSLAELKRMLAKPEAGDGAAKLGGSQATSATEDRPVSQKSASDH
jgi:cytoskeletal protein CcmA (bactofilin family)